MAGRHARRSTKRNPEVGQHNTRPYLRPVTPNVIETHQHKGDFKEW